MVCVCVTNKHCHTTQLFFAPLLYTHKPKTNVVIVCNIYTNVSSLIWNNYGTLHTSTNPPRSLTNIYNLYKSNGCLDMVGHADIGVRRSSIKPSSLSNQPRRSGFSSISYNLHKLSDFFDEVRCTGSAAGTGP